MSLRTTPTILISDCHRVPLAATVTADIASHLPQDTMAGIVYMAPCPYLGIMPSIGTPFILNLLLDLTSTDDATSADDNMQIFFDSCFADAEKISWETRALWKGKNAFPLEIL